MPCAVCRRDPSVGLSLHPKTSYWLGDAKEMAAINTILIIVNSKGLTVPQNSRPGTQIETTFRQKQGELAAGNIPLTNSVIG
jgi:hypothetical protein